MKHRNQTNGGMRLQKKKEHEDLTAAQQEIEACRKRIFQLEYVNELQKSYLENLNAVIEDRDNTLREMKRKTRNFINNGKKVLPNVGLSDGRS